MWMGRRRKSGRHFEEDMTSRFGDKLNKEDERRFSLLLFKVRVFHNDFAFLSVLGIHDFQVYRFSHWKKANIFLLSSFPSLKILHSIPDTARSKDVGLSLEDFLVQRGRWTSEDMTII